MASKIKVDQIEGSTGTTVSLPSGQTLDLSSGSVTLPNSVALPNASVTNAQLAGSIDLTTKVTGALPTGNLPTIPVSKGGTGVTSLGTAGQIIKVNSGANALEFGDAASGTVKQVVHSTGTTTFNSSSSSFVNTPQTITITPQSASSKIIIQMINAIWSANGQYMHFKIDASGGASGRIAEWGDTYTDYYGNHPVTGYHTGHNTTSAITYTLAVRSDGTSFHAPNNNNDSSILNKYMTFAWEVE